MPFADEEAAVATDVTDRRDAVVTSSRTHRRRGAVLTMLAVFQFWLWGTRIVNLVNSDEEVTAAFIAVHAVLYTAAIGAGVVLLVLGVRMLREAAAASRR